VDEKSSAVKTHSIQSISSAEVVRKCQQDRFVDVNEAHISRDQQDLRMKLDFRHGCARYGYMKYRKRDNNSIAVIRTGELKAVIYISIPDTASRCVNIYTELVEKHSRFQWRSAALRLLKATQ
jgi:hypothetical protein